ncbi:uncharacterized protein LOC143587816 [Bidens hawaiensis]|uniref:uncharacterized protein LOC143587816 n=1 Tax=Bidens hawaiensis TaxID=980011 RepID=UPI0040499882
MVKEVQKLKNMISSIPDVVQPILEMTATSTKVLRFALPICDVEIPKRFQNPNMKLYDGTTNPEEHVAQYIERMEIIPISVDLKEACLCKGFGSTLTRLTLKRLFGAPPNSITSFAHLVNLFNNQFSCSRSFEIFIYYLYRITQKHEEYLRYYVGRLRSETLDIPNIDMDTTVQVFKMGLKNGYPFYEDIVMSPCRNLDEVRNRALRFIRLENDQRI